MNGRHSEDNLNSPAMQDLLNDLYLRDNTKPVKKDILAQLPKFKFNLKKEDLNESKNEKDDNKKCSVCLCEYEQDETLLMLPCFHKYHEQCIKDWFKN